MSNETFTLVIPFLRQPLELLTLYCIAYGLVFVLGIVGNSFVVLSLLRDPLMRNVTNYLISSLAISDLLICIFCLPATLLNNILTEWLLGNMMCKLQVWISGTSVCASVYTLVAVSGERYMAICHSFKHKRWAVNKVMLFLVLTWTLSSLLFIPWLVYFQEFNFPVNVTYAKICTAIGFTHQRWYFLVVNFVVAFLIPLVLITVLYAKIFSAIFGRKQPFAVDRGALEREQRIRIRITIMMLVVIILFAFCWLPLYSLFTIINFSPPDQFSPEHPLHTIVRPLFQWLSLANSCINPFLYAFFNAKFRGAFVDLIVHPCRQHYTTIRRRTRDTIRKVSSKTYSRTSDCSNIASSSSKPTSSTNRIDNNNYTYSASVKSTNGGVRNRTNEKVQFHRELRKSSSLNDPLLISCKYSRPVITANDSPPPYSSLSGNSPKTQETVQLDGSLLNHFNDLEDTLGNNSSMIHINLDCSTDAPVPVCENAQFPLAPSTEYDALSNNYRAKITCVSTKSQNGSKITARLPTAKVTPAIQRANSDIYSSTSCGILSGGPKLSMDQSTRKRGFITKIVTFDDFQQDSPGDMSISTSASLPPLSNETQLDHTPKNEAIELDYHDNLLSGIRSIEVMESKSNEDYDLIRGALDTTIYSLHEDLDDMKVSLV